MFEKSQRTKFGYERCKSRRHISEDLRKTAGISARKVGLGCALNAWDVGGIGERRNGDTSGVAERHCSDGGCAESDGGESSKRLEEVHGGSEGVWW